jgi:hypothetical protein
MYGARLLTISMVYDICVGEEVCARAVCGQGIRGWMLHCEGRYLAPVPNPMYMPTVAIMIAIIMNAQAYVIRNSTADWAPFRPLPKTNFLCAKCPTCMLNACFNCAFIIFKRFEVIGLHLGFMYNGCALWPAITSRGMPRLRAAQRKKI